MELRGKRVLVMGLGVHGGGLGVARFLVGQGADVAVTDLRGADLLKPSLDALAGLPIRYVLGEHRDEDFRAADLVIQNPGVPRDSRYLQIARAAGAAVETEMTLFFRRCPGPILGITGTKGKTTTTLLAGAMLRQHYSDTVVAGNLRVSALEALPRITAGTPVVLELSSWQLEGLGEAHLSPQYACVTNVSPDHLNRYSGMADYAQAKKQIFRWQGHRGVVVLNHDDAEVASWAGEAPGAVVWFGARAGAAPSEGNRAAVYDDHGIAWRAGGAGQLTSGQAGEGERICSLEDIRLPGPHNIANVAAAAALAKAFGAPNEAIRAAVRSFSGVEHRLELVRTLDGIRYIDDTTATSPAATIAALQSFDAPIILIAGGADKALPFDELGRAVARRVKRLVLLAGTATARLEQAVRAAEGRTQAQDDVRTAPLQILGPFDDFAQAIGAARAQAQAGDVVLLSPGCASFGMFLNEFHRGDEFRRIVNGLSGGTTFEPD